MTGANGLLGSFVVRKLVQENIPFVALKRAGSDTSLLEDLSDRITWREADICDPVALAEALQDATTVIHVAALVSFHPRDKKKLYNINVLGTRNVVNVCLTGTAKQFIHVSSVGALGKQKGQQQIDEGQKWVSNPLNSTYGETKYLAELEVMRGQEEGLTTVIVNPSVILAPADWNRSSAMLFKYAYREHSFYTDGELNYVDVRDVADIIFQLLKSPFRGERFIANSGTVSYKTLLDMMAANFHKKPPSIRLGRRLVRVLAWLEDVRSRLTGASPLITKETARATGLRVFFSNEKVKNRLNFHFRPVHETLEWCCKHYLQQVNGEK